MERQDVARINKLIIAAISFVFLFTVLASGYVLALPSGLTCC